MRYRLFSLALLLVACDTAQEQNDFEASANATPSGYAQTGEFGDILDDDQDDWRTAPIFFGKVRFDPAFPNPSSGGFVTIPLNVLEFNAFESGLVLRGHDVNGNLRLLDEVGEASSPGAYIFRFSPSILGRTGLLRVFVFDRFAELVTYGDLFVQ